MFGSSASCLLKLVEADEEDKQADAGESRDEGDNWDECLS